MMDFDTLFGQEHIQAALIVIAAVALFLAIVTPILWATLTLLANRRDARRGKMAAEVRQALTRD